MKKKILWTILVIILISSLLLVGCSSSEEEEEGPRIVELGEYPQTIKAADVTITQTIEEGKIYLGSDGARYAKVTAKPYTSYFSTVSYKFSDGTVIEAGESYYFKYEPIKWRVLQENDDGTALVLSEKVLDAQEYYSGYYTIKNDSYYKKDGTGINAYGSSSIRQFLTGTFYTSAFTKDADIQRIKNRSIIYDDKVFLLEQSEAKSGWYGFTTDNSADAARIKMTTDYSRAVGAKISTAEDDYGAGDWWLGSSYKMDDDTAKIMRQLGYDTTPDPGEAAYVTTSGKIEGKGAIGREGVVPALRIILP